MSSFAGRAASSRLGIALALVAILAGGVAVVAGVSTTQAAWNDKTIVSTTVTSGKWAVVPVGNACVAYNDKNQVIAGCKVSSITYKGTWAGPGGGNQRDYYINFASPAGMHHMTFDVDMTSAKPENGAVDWTWSKKPGIASGAQFTPYNGWTCAQLPRIQGRTLDWYTSAYFVAYENKAGQSVVCG